MSQLRITTWNTRGLKQSKRRIEILSSLPSLNQDIFVLQETHISDESLRSQAQKAWTLGPSLWSYGEEKTAGVGVLFRSKEDLQIDSVIDAVPGRLLVLQ